MPSLSSHLGDGERLTKILSSSQPEAPRLLRVLEEGEVDQILPHSDADVVEVVRVTREITGASLAFYLQTDRVDDFTVDWTETAPIKTEEI